MYDYTYTTEATETRVYKLDGRWAVDGVDEKGRYTEQLWKFDTEEEAIANMEKFRKENADVFKLAPVDAESMAEKLELAYRNGFADGYLLGEEHTARKLVEMHDGAAKARQM